MYELIYRTKWNESLGKAPITVLYSDIDKAILQMQEYQLYGWSVEIWKEDNRIF